MAALAIMALAAPATAAPGRGRSHDRAPGPAVRCASAEPEQLTVRVPTSAGLRITDNHVEVLLPSRYCRAGERFPVLYLLHGTGDTYRSWLAQTDLARVAASYQIIVVMPDAGHGPQAGWYSDWRDGSYQWETYETSVLPSYINSHFRTLARDLAVAGNSMGGFGALSLAARHPGMFRAAASFSGAVDTLYGAPASGVAFAELHDRYGTPDSQIWGDQSADQAVWAAHNPTSLAAKLKGVTILLASGTGTPGGPQGDAPADPGDYFLENGIFQMNLSLVRALDAAGVAHSDRFYTGGYHGWPYWQADLHWALPQIARALH
ncbi:MAG TPA: alpha/beta hydrolase family protein [Acidimicrobiales bacterium]|nr:alpha/beta hydrolase family protein [Acidimicrobiales bacterium]